MIKNIDGEEVYKEETMDYNDFEDGVLFNMRADLYPHLDDEMLLEIFADIEENLSEEEYLKLEKRLWDRHRQRRNAERRKQREWLKANEKTS